MNFYEDIILPENLEKDFFLMEYIYFTIMYNYLINWKFEEFYLVINFIYIYFSIFIPFLVS